MIDPVWRRGVMDFFYTRGFLFTSLCVLATMDTSSASTTTINPATITNSTVTTSLTTEANITVITPTTTKVNITETPTATETTPTTITTTTATTTQRTSTSSNPGTPIPICPAVPVTVSVSSDLPVRSTTRIGLQCTMSLSSIRFQLAERSDEYDIVTIKSYPYFQNKKIPKLFNGRPTFQINMTVAAIGRNLVFIPITIRVVEVNDPPIIRTQFGEVTEGLLPVFQNMQINIRVTDPDDDGNENGRGNITITSPDLPEQIRITQQCRNGLYCLEIVKPFDADIYSLDGGLEESRFFEKEESKAAKYGHVENLLRIGNLINGPPVVRITLVATDGGNLSSTAMFTINIRDINDNPPVCHSPGTVHASPASFERESGGIDLSRYCIDADNTARNRIVADGYRLFGQQACPNVFNMFRSKLVADNRFLHPNIKSCKVSLIVTDRKYATDMSFTVIFGRCSGGYDESGRYWNETDPTDFAYAPCPEGYYGLITRKCDLNATFQEPEYNCVKAAIRLISEKVHSEQIETIMKELNNETKSTTNTTLFKGDVQEVVSILARVNERLYTHAANVTDIVEDYLEVANSLIEEKNTKSWKSIISADQIGADTVLRAVDVFLEKLANEMGNQSAEYSKSNLVIQVGRSVNCSEDIDFPNRRSSTLPEWAKKSRDRLFLPCDGEYSSYSTAIYRNISNMMQTTLVQNSSTAHSSERAINSPVMSLSVYPKSPILPAPITLTFEVFDKDLEQPICAYWKFLLRQFRGPFNPRRPDRGYWTTDGCILESYKREAGIVVCKCDHLTNFAILMSPRAQMSVADQLALSIITVIGCVISCVCLVMTVTVHVVFYRAVKSDRTTILLNLCVALFTAYIIFLVGVTRTENKVGCTVISVLLHFLYLTVFLLMLAEGVDLGYRAFSKTTKHPVGRYFTIGAYVGSAVIVVISAGATQLQGYGNSRSCWLSTDSGLIWAFIAPALCVIAINLVICVCVLKQMFGLSAIQQKSTVEKAKVGVRGILVMLPVMGLTWIFGVFSVSQSTVVFQYLFALFNSIQGALLFIFHCLLNKKIRDSFKSAKTRFLSQDSESGSTSKNATKKTATSSL